MLKDKMKNYNKAKISRELKIPKTTLYRWIRGEGLEEYIRFIELLIYLDIDIQKFIEEYKKTSKN